MSYRTEWENFHPSVKSWDFLRGDSGPGGLEQRGVWGPKRRLEPWEDGRDVGSDGWTFIWMDGWTFGRTEILPLFSMGHCPFPVRCPKEEEEN